jgi:hypothetical protein
VRFRLSRLDVSLWQGDTCILGTHPQDRPTFRRSSTSAFALTSSTLTLERQRQNFPRGNKHPFHFSAGAEVDDRVNAVKKGITHVNHVGILEVNVDVRVGMRRLEILQQQAQTGGADDVQLGTFSLKALSRETMVVDAKFALASATELASIGILMAAVFQLHADAFALTDFRLQHRPIHIL